MTDFLTRLVERTFGTSEVAQPLAMPLFAGEQVADEVSPQLTHMARQTAATGEEAQPTDDPGESPALTCGDSDNRVLEPNEELMRPQREEYAVAAESFAHTDGIDRTVEAGRKEVKCVVPEAPESMAGSADSDSGLFRPGSDDEARLCPESEPEAPSGDVRASGGEVVHSADPDRPTVSEAAKPPTEMDSEAAIVPAVKGTQRPSSARPSETGTQNKLSPSQSTRRVEIKWTGSLEHSALPRNVDGGVSGPAGVQTDPTDEETLFPSRSERETPETVNERSPSRLMSVSGIRGTSVPAEPQSESSDLPSVKVTIGRIDVRAVTKSAAAPVRRPTSFPQPSVSLQDYLKQRTRGQR